MINEINQGRNVLYYQLQNSNDLVKKAFKKFNQNYTIAISDVNNLMNASHYNVLDLKPYDLKKHKFESKGFQSAPSLLKISKEEGDEYLKDHLQNYLIQNLVKEVMGENSNEENTLKKFLTEKCGNLNNWNELFKQVESDTFLSAQQKEEKRKQKEYEESPKGQLEIKRKQLETIKNKPTECNDFIKNLKSLDLSAFKEDLEKATAHSDNMKSFKETLIQLISKIKEDSVEFKDFLNIKNWASIKNTPDDWRKIKGFADFKTNFTGIIEEELNFSTDISNLELEIKNLSDMILESEIKELKLEELEEVDEKKFKEIEKKKNEIRKELNLLTDKINKLILSNEHPNKGLISSLENLNSYPIAVLWQIYHASSLLQDEYGKVNLGEFGFEHLKEEDIAKLYQVLNTYHKKNNKQTLCNHHLEFLNNYFFNLWNQSSAKMEKILDCLILADDFDDIIKMLKEKNK